MSPEWNETLYRVLIGTSLRAAAIAAIVALILLTLRVRSSGVRHAAWAAVLFAMLLLPVIPYLTPSIPISVPVPGAVFQTKTKTLDTTPTSVAILSSDFESAPIRGTGHPSLSPPNPKQKPIWPVAATVFYFLGILVFVSRALLGWRAMSRIARECKPVALGPVICPELRYFRAPVCESEVVAAPLTVGSIAPRVIIPVTWRQWPAEKLNAVLAHEFSHIRRRDTLIAPLAHLNRCLFWFHPLAWWLERKLAATAELACDDEAVRVIGETKLYAEALLDMAKAVRRRGGRLAWQGIGVNGDGFLGQRIDRLLCGELLCEISRFRKAVVAVGCTAAIFLAGACRQKPQAVDVRENPKPAAQRSQDTLPRSLWAKRLRIMTNPVNAPFVFGSGTSVQGLDVDIGNEVGRNLKIEVKWIKAPGPGYKQNRLKRVIDALFARPPGTLNDYELMLELLKRDQADILISAIAIDPQNSADFDFSKPYYETGDIIARQRDNSDITNLGSLSGRRVGVAAGRPGEAFMARQKTAAGVVLTKYSSIDDALGALNRREIDAVVGDEPLITYSSVKSFHNTAIVPVLIHRYKYVAVVQKGKKELVAKINATIDGLKSAGELKRLDERWLGDVRKDALELRQAESVSLGILQ